MLYLLYEVHIYTYDRGGVSVATRYASVSKLLYLMWEYCCHLPTGRTHYTHTLNYKP